MIKELSREDLRTYEVFPGRFLCQEEAPSSWKVVKFFSREGQMQKQRMGSHVGDDDVVCVLYF